MKITPEEQRQLAARACTSRQNLDQRGIKVKHSARKNKASALKYADAMANVAVQSTNRADVLYEFAGVDGMTEYALHKVADFIGCTVGDIGDAVLSQTAAENAIYFKQWMFWCDKIGNYDLSSKIAGAWAFYTSGEWDEQ